MIHEIKSSFVWIAQFVDGIMIFFCILTSDFRT